MAKLIIANWKSHKQPDEVSAWWETFSRRAKLLPTEAQIVICPPFPLLSAVSQLLASTSTLLGVQDISPFPSGAYTGAVSALNLAGMNCQYAIVGHSERRRYFHETHQDVANKVDQLLIAGITPIICVDEEYAQAQASALPSEHLAKCVVAYEPLEAIGTGDNQPADEVAEVVASLHSIFGTVPVLYGGSVKPANAAEYFAVCDGVLVGSASLDPDALADIGQQAKGL